MELINDLKRIIKLNDKQLNLEKNYPNYYKSELICLYDSYYKKVIDDNKYTAYDICYIIQLQEKFSNTINNLKKSK